MSVALKHGGGASDCLAQMRAFLFVKHIADDARIPAFGFLRLPLAQIRGVARDTCYPVSALSAEGPHHANDHSGKLAR